MMRGIGHCGLCGTQLQPLMPRPPDDSWPGQWQYAGPNDGPGVAALKAHTAVVHPDADLLPPLYSRWPKR